MGFVFVPLTTMSMATLPQDQIGNACGIYNLMRNTGGSVGIAIMTHSACTQSAGASSRI